MLKQSQLLKQAHKIIPRQIATLHIFHLDCISLEQRIQDEINDNPMLDQNPEALMGESRDKNAVQDFQNADENSYDDIPDYKTEYRNYIATEHVPDRVYTEQTDYRTELKRQFRMAEKDESTYDTAAFIIDSLNEKGFLEQGLEKMAQEISFKNKKWIADEELKGILNTIRLLDPRGCGAVDIREYLLIQLRLMDARRPDVKKAICLLEHHFSSIGACKPGKLAAALGLESDEVTIVLHLIASLKKSPVDDSGFAGEVGNIIVPDFTIEPEGEDLVVNLTHERSSSLHINAAWPDQQPIKDESARRYIESKLAAARWFIDAIREREINMLKIIKAIVSYQRDYFLSGDSLLLKPMVLKNIAERVGLDISTVSRITCNKYAQTPAGNILLKDLFSEGLSDRDGNLVSNRVLREIMGEIINQEDKSNPYSDQQLSQELLKKGYKVARRTVLKYREQCNIPSAKIRSFNG